MRVLGTWDDNDYGKKNGGKEYSKKVESQQILWTNLETARAEGQKESIVPILSDRLNDKSR
jgi:hypothetical protein